MKNLEKTDYQILLFVASKNNTTLSAIKKAFSENTSAPEDRLKVLAEHKLIIIHTEYVPYKGKSKNVMGDFEPNGQISIKAQVIKFNTIAIKTNLSIDFTLTCTSFTTPSSFAISCMVFFLAMYSSASSLLIIPITSPSTSFSFVLVSTISKQII